MEAEPTANHGVQPADDAASRVGAHGDLATEPRPHAQLRVDGPALHLLALLLDRGHHLLGALHHRPLEPDTDRVAHRPVELLEPAREEPALHALHGLREHLLSLAQRPDPGLHIHHLLC